MRGNKKTNSNKNKNKKQEIRKLKETRLKKNKKK
jgi:hypothetical protein